MEKLSLEESKKIVTKFLKHFDLYDDKKVEKYFNPGLFSFHATKLFEDLELPKPDDPQVEYEDILEKYEDYFEILDESKYAFSLIVDALTKVTNKNILAVSDRWELNRNDLKKHVLMFTLNELADKKRKSNPVEYNLPFHEKVYLFSEDLSFLIIVGSNECGALIASTKNFINRFKNSLKQKQYDKIANLKIEDKMIINDVVYRITKITSENSHLEIKYLHFDKNYLALELTLYDSQLVKIKESLGFQVFGSNEEINSIRFE